MVSSLSSISSRHSHVFRDLARMMRADGSAQVQDSSGAHEAPEDSADVAETDQDSKGSEEMISALQSRNRDVMSHEAAHLAAAGGYAKGGASYTYQIGPDGKSYAIGGEVDIDMSPIPGNPRATITKMMAIRAAALSPADPSGQDVSVAAAAAQIEAQARAQLNQVQTNGSSNAVGTAADRYTKQTVSAGTHVNATA